MTLLLVHSISYADDVSGPNHSTIRQTSWGSIFYDPVFMGNHYLDYKIDDITIRSRFGDVKIIGSETNGYRLSYGKDELTIRSNFSGFEIRWHEKLWSLQIQNARYTLSSNSPKDIIVFERNGNNFTIKGQNGFISVNSNPNLISIQSSEGSETIKTYLGSRSFSGIGIDKLPYLGRGIYISFHGIGILIDVLKLFSRPEIAEWTEWKPLIGSPFDPDPH